MKDPLDSGAQQGICRGKDSRTKADKTDAVNWFEGLDVRLSKGRVGRQALYVSKP